MKARKLVVGVLAASMLVLAACGGSNGGSKSSSSGASGAGAGSSAAGTSAAASSGAAGGGSGESITYWASNQGSSIDADKQILTPQLQKFQQQTGIKVNLEVIGWPDLWNRIQTAVSSGSGPDVLNIGNTWAASLQATGAFLPFDSATLDAIGGKDKFVSTAWDTTGVKGQDPTSVPLYGLAYALYYNKKMFSDAGLQPPTTWEEMVSAAQKLTDASKGVYGMSLAAGSTSENIHFAFITAAQNNSAFYTDDGKMTYAEDGNVQGVLRYLDLMQKDKVVNPACAQYQDGSKSVSDFAAGKAAMILNQNNADNTIQAAGMKAEEYGVVPFPAPADGQKIASFPAGINVSVFKNTKHKDAALQFVKFMTSQETQTDLAKQFTTLPVLNGMTPNFTTNADEAATFQKVYGEMSKPMPVVPSEGDWENAVGKQMTQMFQKIATGSTISADQIKSSLTTAQQQVEAAGD